MQTSGYIMPSMDMDKHALALGHLVGNFQSLEFALRGFLLNDKVASGKVILPLEDLNTMNEGDVVHLNAFTNYDNLGQLIDKYNNHTKILSARLTIDRTLVKIRDATAHGRVSGDAPEPPYRLLKFGKPINDKVEVTFSVLMTIDWFNEQISRVYNAITKVSEANERLQSGTL